MSLRELRLKRGMTQQQLADKVPGITRGRVAAWENGQRDISKISLDLACRVADALRVANPRRLLDDAKPAPDADDHPTGTEPGQRGADHADRGELKRLTVERMGHDRSRV